MKRFEKKMLNTLSDHEVKNLYGGFAPPTKEEMESKGWLQYVICW